MAPVVKNLPPRAGDVSSIPGWGGSPREGNGNPLQFSCLGNPMDRGLWATVHGVAKSRTRLSNWQQQHTWKRPRENWVTQQNGWNTHFKYSRQLKIKEDVGVGVWNVKKEECRTFLVQWLSGPVIKNLLPNAEDSGSIPGWETKIPHAEGQLSLWATTGQPVHHNRKIYKKTVLRKDPKCCKDPTQPNK